MYTFKIMTLDQLIDYFNNFKFARPIVEIHLHHTWKPNYYSFNKLLSKYGKDLSVSTNVYNQVNNGMKVAHITNRKFSDIAQHITVFPDGMIAIGRDWNKIPASATGHNTGAFMLEFVGNFDVEGRPDTEYNSFGYDKITDEQYEVMVKFSRAFIDRFKYDTSHIRTHNEFTDEKTCFGNGMDIKKVRKDVEMLEKIDYSIPSDWAKETWEDATKKGITDGSNPKNLTSREQTVQMIYNAQKAFKKEAIEEVLDVVKDIIDDNEKWQKIADRLRME